VSLRCFHALKDAPSLVKTSGFGMRMSEVDEVVTPVA